MKNLSKAQLLLCLCCGITYRLRLRLLDIVLTKKKFKSGTTIKTKINHKWEAVCISESSQSRWVRQTQEREREAAWWGGNPCSNRGAVAQRDFMTLAKVIQEAWAELGNEARAPETLNHKEILLFHTSSCSSSLLQAEKCFNWTASVPKISSIVSHSGILNLGSSHFIFHSPLHSLCFWQVYFQMLPW